ncbi:MAG: D-tyrosyl-tRNA(Tyr) deacylase [Desulfotignum sp.]|nr:D-tyrosyl-tRNA(Tyr) deacylase [Desulfotignum sp.]MCF8113521.1 D-tyrosyl-tRNA(Tyr) deacylase [Desulfotignum sp.]MCF8125751.1 D-tyrosyl-tRNA(Tyr) deacylase [Desulfotignum sp.]
MRALIQRVKQAEVVVDDTRVSGIGPGMLVLLGIQAGDTEKDTDYLVEKIIHLRIFEDDQGKMNRSLKDLGLELLVVSQFTLLGDCRKGRRPSFTRAAPPDQAQALYTGFIERAKAAGIPTAAGQFQAEMAVSLINHGPVTLMLDTRQMQ